MKLSIVVLVGTIFSLRFLRFISTPLLRKLGCYRYYSPMFFTIPFLNNTLDIHLGTSWDFIRHLQVNPRRLLYFLAEGLLRIIADARRGNIRTTTRLRGNTYFLKKSSLEKFGFMTRKMNLIEWLLFLFTYLEISILQSISHKRLTFVPLRNVCIVYCTVGDLIRHQSRIERIARTLMPTKAVYYRSDNKIIDVEDKIANAA
jgi:hypothetical protein